jgi:hypothetical protein
MARRTKPRVSGPNVVTFADMFEKATKRATEPCRPHIPFESSMAVRYFLALEAQWNSPRTSRSRRMEIIAALEEAAHPSGGDALVISASERKLIIQLRGLCGGWGEPEDKSSSGRDRRRHRYRPAHAAAGRAHRRMVRQSYPRRSGGDGPAMATCGYRLARYQRTMRAPCAPNAAGVKPPGVPWYSARCRSTLSPAG